MQFSPYALLNFAVTLVSLLLAVAIWSRRPGAGVIPFVVMALGLTLWAFSSGMQLLLTDLNNKLLLTHLMYVGITIVPPTWLLFVLQYTGNDKWMPPRGIMLLTIEPILVQLIMVTNPLHHLFWESIGLGTSLGYVILADQLGTGFWIHAVYSYVLLLISAVLLVRAFIRSPHLYRGQVIFLLIGTLAPWAANFIFLAGLSPLPTYVDLTPPSFLILVIAVAWSLYRFRLMDIVPVARDMIIDNMKDSILVIDRSNRIVDINRAALDLLSLSPDSAIGRPAATVIAGREKIIQEFREVNEVDTEIQTEIDGQTRTFNLKITPIRNRQQELSARIVVLHDITTLIATNNQFKVASERAEESTRLKSQFLATVSHELRTPLNAIIGYTELSLMGMVGTLNEAQTQYQERVLANSKHLLSLINEILDLSRIEAGRLDMIKQPFHVQTWLREIVEQNAVLASEKGIEFKTELDPHLPATLVGDAPHLRQIVVNLISNAIKFTKKGTVSLLVQLGTADFWTISVCDTGIGIPPHKQETIFTEFYQVDGTLTREYGGTGLGLAIVRKLTTTMGGTIRVNSSVGAGSTFTVTLPLITTQSSATSGTES